MPTLTHRFYPIQSKLFCTGTMPVQQQDDNDNNGTVFFDDSDVIVITGSDFETQNDAQSTEHAEAGNGNGNGNENPTTATEKKPQTKPDEKPAQRTSSEKSESEHNTDPLFFFQSTHATCLRREIEQSRRAKPSQQQQQIRAADDFIAKLPKPAAFAAGTRPASTKPEYAVSTKPKPKLGGAAAADQAQKKKMPKPAFSTWKSFQDPNLRC